MGFLDGLVKGATDLASRGYDQLNPFDNNRTFQQRAPTNNASLIHQTTHNGLTNATGSFVNNLTGSAALIDTARLGVANLTHNQGAQNRASDSLLKNLPRFLPIGAVESFKNGFGQDIATAITNPWAERQAQNQADYARRVMNGYSNNPLYNNQVDEYANSIQNQLLNQQLATAGINQNTKNSTVTRKVLGHAAQTAFDIAFMSQMGNGALKLGPKAVVKHGLKRQAAEGGLLNAGASIAGVAGSDNPTNRDYLKAGGLGLAQGVAMPVALHGVAHANTGMNELARAANPKNALDAFTPKFNGLKQDQVIMNLDHLNQLKATSEMLKHRFSGNLEDQYTPTTAQVQQSVNAMHDIKGQYGHDFISGSPHEISTRIDKFMEQNGEAVPQLQKKLMEQQSKQSYKEAANKVNQDGGYMGGKSRQERIQEELAKQNVPKELQKQWYRGVDEFNRSAKDHYYSADKDVAGDYGKVQRVKPENVPKNPLMAMNKDVLAHELGFKGNAYTNEFDTFAKKYAQSKGHDSIHYEDGSLGAPEIHKFAPEPQAPKPTTVLGKAADNAKRMLFDEKGSVDPFAMYDDAKKALSGKKPKELPVPASTKAQDNRSVSSTGSIAPKKALPKPEPDYALSKFPNKLLEDPRTEPIHKQLLRQATHEVKHNAPVLEKTAAKIAQNEESALNFAKKGTSTEANATALQLLDKYLNEGSMDKADDLLKSINPRFTRQGQETQILATFSKLTPAGAVRYAARKIEKVGEKTANGKKLIDETANMHGALNNTVKDIADQLEAELAQGKLSPKELNKIGKNADKTAKTPEQMLADRIKVGESQKKNAPDPIKDMVNTLHKVAKEVLPEPNKSVPRDPMTLIGQAIKDKEGYSDVWKKAQDIVAEKYKDNPNALAELDKYFNSSLSRPFSKSQLNMGVQQGLKGTDLGKLVKEHFTKIDETGAELKTKLIERAGLSEKDATQLAGDIQKRYKELIDTRRESVLKQMFGEKPTKEQISAGQKVINMSNLGALGRDEFRGAAAKKLGLPSLSPEAAKTITDMANGIQGLAEGSVERSRATAKMMQYISKQVPSSGLDKAIGIWKAGLLTGAKTTTGNFLSNSSFAVLHDLSKPGAVALDKIISMFPGQERSQALTYRKKVSGNIEGFKKAFGKDGFLWTGLDERGEGNKFVENGARRTNYKNKAVDTYVNGVFQNMGAQDRAPYYSQLRNSTYDLAVTDGINKGLKGSELKTHAEALFNHPPLEIMERAKLEADKSVLANDTALGNLASGARRQIDGMENGVEKAIAKTVLETTAPFTGVPSAFLSRVVDFTPAGALKEIGDQIYHKKFDQRALTTALSEATTGTAIMWLGSTLAKNNMLSGAYPTDPKEQARWKAEGITPNSIKIGGTWRSANYLGPTGMLLNAGARAHDASSKGGNAIDQITQAAGGVPKDLTQQSFLQGVNNAVSAVNDPGRYLNNYINSQAGSVVPTLVNDIGSASDEYIRDKNSPLDAIKARLPGARNTLPISNDVFGNQLKATSNPIDRMINPLRPSTERTSPILDEVNRLHTKDLNVMPVPVAKKLSFDGEKVNLSNEKRKELQIQLGQGVQNEWNKAIETPEYKALTDEGKKNMLDDIYKKVSEGEKYKFTQSNSLGQFSPTYTGKGNKLSADAKSYVNGGLDLNRFAKEPDAKTALGTPAQKYQSALDQYAIDKKNGDISSVQDIARQNTLAGLKFNSTQNPDIIALHSLPKADVYKYLSTAPNGNDLAKQLLAYDQAATQAGVQSTSKFYDSKGNVSIQPKAKRVASGRGRTGSRRLPRPSVSSNRKFATARVKKASFSAKGSSRSLASFKKPSSKTVAVSKKRLRSHA